jgi:D-glycero-alpha-D-manno-heptose-7-phosphate kinase
MQQGRRDADDRRGLLEASAPTRIDLAGGTIDIWPLYLFHEGAQTIHAAISLRARASLQPRSDGRLVWDSIDTGRHVDLQHWSELRNYPETGLIGRVLYYFRAENVTITTSGESPAGAGIAGSSALNIAACAVLARWTGLTMSDEALMETAQNLEAQAINVPTGLQDFRPALFGGIAALELRPDGARRVALDIAPPELEERLVLVYTGEPRDSGTNNWEITKRHIDGDSEIHRFFDRIRDAAATMRSALERRDWDEVGRQITADWDTRKRLAPGVTTPVIDRLMDRARTAGALGAKVCGAGGGGCVFFFADPSKIPAVRQALIDEKARVLDFHIESRGLMLG